MIKNSQLIISNTGDSRIVLYKNGKVFFVTKDHKPDSDIEKQRIKKAGGTVYQSPSIIPIYQNGKKINLPWRVLPGRLSVSRTFGDIEAKLEKFGGKQGVIVPTPDVTEIELNNEFDFMVIGCDGIFDVLSNEDLFEIWSIVLKERKMNGNTFRNREKNNEIDIDNLCGDFAGLIIKSALARNSFDNVSCIVVVFNINSYDNNKTNCNINNEEVISEYYKQ
jgi:serine/threonine protein phosphatase PrpC